MAIELPANWNTFQPAEKIEYFNQTGVTPAQLLGEGVSVADVNWMLNNGYTGGSTAVGNVPAPRTVIEGDSVDRTRVDATSPIGTGITFDLPQGWQNFNPGEKIAYFNQANITPTDLLNVGVSQEDINWMRSNGYTAGAPVAPPVTPPRESVTIPSNRPVTPTTPVTPPVTPTTPVTPPVTSVPGYTLPAGWTGFTPAEKISWFNANNVRPSQLTAAGVPAEDVNWMMNNGYTAGRPFANATQGFAQNFQNYTSIPIGAQYNPNVTAFGESPYSQLQTQMQPFANPYANFQSGQAMGGYDPNLYNTDLLTSFVEDRAEKAIADRAAAAAEAAAADAAMYAAYDGGLITKVMGPNPPTPDDGTMFVQKGEYIVKKSSVNKYGKGLLDMINDGKIPVSKMKSLLG
jgi:hypothetical protein